MENTNHSPFSSSNRTNEFFQINSNGLIVINEEIFNRFEGSPKKWKLHNYIFNIIQTYISTIYIDNHRFFDAGLIWEDVIRQIREWEKKKIIRIHKGSAYFFWAYTALLNNELTKGFFLIHQAYKEDCLTTNRDKPNTPAFKTIGLISSKKNLLYGLVVSICGYINNFLCQYRKINRSKLTLQLIKREFIKSPPSFDLLIHLVYTLTRMMKYEFSDFQNVDSDFVTLYELGMLFDLVMVIDNSIFHRKGNPRPLDWKYNFLARDLSIAFGYKQNNITKFLEQINEDQKRNFDLTIQKLSEEKYLYFDGSKPTKLQCDIGISYAIRNFSAHNILSSRIVHQKFHGIIQSLFNVLFACIEKFY